MTISSFLFVVSMLLLIALCVYCKLSKENRFNWYATGKCKYDPLLMYIFSRSIMIVAVVNMILSIAVLIKTLIKL